MNAAVLRLTVPARAENVGVIRQALAGLAEAVEMDSGALADLKTAVTEACMNVVRHAYDGHEGPLEIHATHNGELMTVSVRDRGSGIQPRPSEPAEASLRIGLPLIAALSDAFEILGGVEKGTEIRIHKRIWVSEDVEADGAAADGAGPAAPSGTDMRIAAGAMVRPVLARVIAILAARADFSIDRLSDAVLIGDAVSAHAASDFPDETVGIKIEDEEGSLEVRIGPLAVGAGERMLGEMRIPGIGASLAQLVEETRIETGEDGGAEHLVLRISQGR
ncbi:MAG: serine/threonine-protein kinase RsbW [Solirubrobacterales bacterium]|nr:serine/threonine-protein kinase RsbW [Solirubrobacterales bacterium]